MRLLVLHDVDVVGVAALHALLLFAERTEEVLHESPLQESAVLVGPGTFQIGELANFGNRVLGGGHDAFVVVEVEEHFYFVADVHVGGDVTLWE